MALSMATLSSRAFARLRSQFYVCATVLRGRAERERDFSRTGHVQNGVSGTMGPRAIIGFASAYRPRIMPSRVLPYSPEDLFRHAHNRQVCFSKGHWAAPLRISDVTEIFFFQRLIARNCRSRERK